MLVSVFDGDTLKPFDDMKIRNRILKKTKESKKDNRLALAASMFRAKASKADSSVTITFTTPAGQTYTQTITRPAPFAVK